MALPVSAISQACRSVRDFLDDQLGGDSDKIEVLLGTPAAAAEKLAADSSGLHWLNLFFHRITPSGFEAAITPGDPWRIRLHCLVTAFANSGADDGISSGENDLRLLGDVVRLFHEHPILANVDVEGQPVRLQAIFNPLELEEISQLWGTQGDVPYRPSVLYQFTLAPVVPATPAVKPGRVAAVGSEVRATMEARHASFSGDPETPPVLVGEVDINNPHWAPKICFLQDGTCRQSVIMELGSGELAAFQPKVWIAGDSSATVSLNWEVWDSGSGWSEGPAVAGDHPPFSGRIDPENPPTGTDLASLPGITPPFDDHAGQAVLYATRTYRIGNDKRDRVVRSNPLLITLYEGGGA